MAAADFGKFSFSGISPHSEHAKSVGLLIRLVKLFSTFTTIPCIVPVVMLFDMTLQFGWILTGFTTLGTNIYVSSKFAIVTSK